MRIRTVKPAFFRHGLLQDLEIKHPHSYIMLTYQGLWGLCDNQGVFKFDPREIRLDILPFITYDRVETLAILSVNGFIETYEDERGNRYGYVSSFRNHQRLSGKELKSGKRYPHPDTLNRVEMTPKTGKQRGSTREAPEQQRGSDGEATVFSPSLPQKLDNTDNQYFSGAATGKHQGSTREAPGCPGREGKGREGKGVVPRPLPEKQQGSNGEAPEKHPALETEGDFQKKVAPKKSFPEQPPDWMDVAQAMDHFFTETEAGKKQWAFMCEAAGGFIPPGVITTIWAGKHQDSAYVLTNWRNHVGKLTNWISTELNKNKRKEGSSNQSTTASTQIIDGSKYDDYA